VIGEYETRPLDLSGEGLRDCARLLQRVFPHAPHLTERYLEWQYVRNPHGRAIGFNAYRRDELAAHYVTLPVAARLEGRASTGVLSLNTATHPEHQGRNLFTTLAEKTYETAAALGHDFVVGVANANSTPGFTKKLGFQLVGRLDARLGIGRPARAEASEATAFERAWERPSLAWRLANPSRGYRVRKDGSACRVLAATERPGIQALLGEFEPGIAPEAPERDGLGFRPLTLWIGLDPDVRWSRSLYLDVPGPFRRSPLNLIFRPLGSARPPVREEVRFRAIDFDPY
jgi:GNAT superfamily N-acetyltransferase